jgi:hypothetical protein
MRTAQTANTLTGETYRKVAAVHAMKAYGRVEKKLHSFLTLGNDGVNGQLQAPAVLPSGKVSPLAIIQETVGWAPEPVWMLHTRKTCCSCQVRPLAQRLRTTTRYPGSEGTSAYASMTVVFRR